MRIAWKIFRAFVSVLLLMAVLIPTALYVLLSTTPVQKEVRNIASRELTKLLGADVEIGRINIHPFNRLALEEISVVLPDGSRPASVDNLRAGFELRHFLQTGQLIIDYVFIDGIHVAVSRVDSVAPLNVQPILDHLRSDKQDKEPAAFEMKVNNVVLRNGTFSYDVLSAPPASPGRFDSRHIAVRDLALNAYLPMLGNEDFKVDIDHLSLSERSGFILKRAQFKTEIDSCETRIDKLILELPGSRFSVAPIALRYNGLKNIGDALKYSDITIVTEGPNHIFPPDLAAFAPFLGDIDSNYIFELDATGSLENIELRRFAIRDNVGSKFNMALAGSVWNLDSISGLQYKLKSLSLVADGYEISEFLGNNISPKLSSTISLFPSIGLHADGEGSLKEGSFNIKCGDNTGNIGVKGRYTHPSEKAYSLNAEAAVDGIDLGMIFGKEKIGLVSGNIHCNVKTSGKTITGKVHSSISRFDYADYSYTGISIGLDMPRHDRAEINVEMHDPHASVLAYAFYNRLQGAHDLKATVAVAGVDFNVLGFDPKHEGYTFGFKANADLQGSTPDDVEGYVQLTDIRWTDFSGKGLRVNRFNVNVEREDNLTDLTIDSDIIKGNIHGECAFSLLPQSIGNMLSDFLPALVSVSGKKMTKTDNRFKYDFTLLPSPKITEFLDIPVNIIHDARLSGHVDTRTGSATLEFDAPFLSNGDKLIEETSVFAKIDTAAAESMIYLTTQFPTNKGDMALTGIIKAFDNRIDTQVDWLIQRRIPLNGSLSFSALLHDKPSDYPAKHIVPFPVSIDFNPGTINFGDETWDIKSSTILLNGKDIAVDGFGLDSGTQSIAIDGSVSDSPADSLSIDLAHISLLPIFETLEINKALISGKATGKFIARDVLSENPSLICEHLHVDSIGYNYCTIGDAEILAGWNNEKKSFFFDADIIGPEDNTSRITGDIFPFREALDIDFHANHVPVGFLKPFMEAFTSDISGYASGDCRLFGTFKEIDLEGKVFADNVKLKIDFINASYTATDSVLLEPGIIRLVDVPVKDPEGHTATLNGFVEHTFFKEPVFRFDITDARDFLAFNGTPKQNPDWYGTIYGNGTASVSGYPGVVNIDADMTTAPRSTFTFVLSDRLDAETYSFINFRDVTPDSLKRNNDIIDNTPELVRLLKNKLLAQAEDEPSAYNMDIRVGITKDATMILVMDPVGGDEIKAVGQGNLHLAYQSTDNNLNIWGSYRVLSGSYRFTLQDIIIRDFTIKEGSEIRFDGDPYAVRTSLTAYYATNANLTDLDKSFQEDKDLSRTNVPVHALMYVDGVVTQPEIKFDLEFPTNSQDIYRKVRSIVSTEDMMNRQIIYLLALNRFYTPDYMASTTKGSELFSVASSTISNQLGNMLGKLSDNWSIAPNLRSDQGDFSDIEVDVALSSRLLNNRLLFNGNFGYRDKSLNTNQFIGDFDIEYLLNKPGTWRLKAYNRYNDRNYYARSAQTTQGVGIMFRRDFDDFLSFLRKFRKHGKENHNDSIR